MAMSSCHLWVVDRFQTVIKIPYVGLGNLYAMLPLLIPLVGRKFGSS